MSYLMHDEIMRAQILLVPVGAGLGLLVGGTVALLRSGRRRRACRRYRARLGHAREAGPAPPPAGCAARARPQPPVRGTISVSVRPTAASRPTTTLRFRSETDIKRS